MALLTRIRSFFPQGNAARARVLVVFLLAVLLGSYEQMARAEVLYTVRSKDCLSGVLYALGFTPIYGKKGLIERAIKPLNPNLDLHHLKEGDEVTLPEPPSRRISGAVFHDNEVVFQKNAVCKIKSPLPVLVDVIDSQALPAQNKGASLQTPAVSQPPVPPVPLPVLAPSLPEPREPGELVMIPAELEVVSPPPPSPPPAVPPPLVEPTQPGELLFD